MFMKHWVMLVLCAATFFVAPPADAFQKKVKGALREKDARRAISTMNGVELPTSAVSVKSISSTSTSAEVLAGVKTAFRFRRSGEGKEAKWVASEVRTGERRWEDLALLIRVLDAGANPSLVSDLETLAARLEAQQLSRQKSEQRDPSQDSSEATAKGGREKSNDESQEARKGEDENRRSTGQHDEKPAAEGELRQGAILVKSFSALHSSATVEAEIEAGFRLAKETGNKWRVVEIRIGESEWRNVDSLVASVNAEKNLRARAEMGILGTALESFRRERGAYVVADDHTVLVDYLSPRHLPRIIRIDPWHRPYRYAGTRDHYTLRSDGADGKENTADDVTLGNRS